MPHLNNIDASRRGKLGLNQKRSQTSFLLRVRSPESKTRFFTLARPWFGTYVLPGSFLFFLFMQMVVGNKGKRG